MLVKEKEEIGPAKDCVPESCSPWRRLFARSLDWFFYGIGWNILLVFAGNVNLSARTSFGDQIFGVLITMLLMLLLEPIFLHFFGTTPGKWILGIRVLDRERELLSYTDALERTWLVMREGLGLQIPVYNLICQWKSYCACVEGKRLSWEKDSTLELRIWRIWRVFAAAGGCAVLVGILAFSIVAAEMPCHRGDLTPKEFCENYNRLAAYFQEDSIYVLDEEGKHMAVEQDYDSGVLRIGGDFQYPDFVFRQKDGKITAVEFCFENRESSLWAPSFQRQMMLSAMAFAGAQKEFGLFENTKKEVLEKIQSHPFESFCFSEGGVRFMCDVRQKGYQSGPEDYLWPKEGEEVFYSFYYKMELE